MGFGLGNASTELSQTVFLLEALADLDLACGYARLEVALGAVADLCAESVLGVEVGGDDHVAGGGGFMDACAEEAVNLDTGWNRGALADQVFAGIAGFSLAPCLLGLGSRRAGSRQFCL